MKVLICNEAGYQLTMSFPLSAIICVGVDGDSLKLNKGQKIKSPYSDNTEYTVQEIEILDHYIIIKTI